MQVTLLYFADAARHAGVSREEVALEGEGDLAALQQEVFRRHPELRALRGSLLWSVDEEMAAPQTRLRTGQTVGVMPPFSGG